MTEKDFNSFCSDFTFLVDKSRFGSASEVLLRFLVYREHIYCPEDIERLLSLWRLVVDKDIYLQWEYADFLITKVASAEDGERVIRDEFEVSVFLANYEPAQSLIAEWLAGFSDERYLGFVISNFDSERRAVLRYSFYELLGYLEELGDHNGLVGTELFEKCKILLGID